MSRIKFTQICFFFSKPMKKMASSRTNNTWWYFEPETGSAVTGKLDEKTGEFTGQHFLFMLLLAYEKGSEKNTVAVFRGPMVNGALKGCRQVRLDDAKVDTNVLEFVVDEVEAAAQDLADVTFEPAPSVHTFEDVFLVQSTWLLLKLRSLRQR